MIECQIDTPRRNHGTNDQVRPEPRLLVMSNRAPIRLVPEAGKERIEPTTGGMGTSFFHVLARRGGCWIAWSGGQIESRRLGIPSERPQFDLVLLSLSEREVCEYYYEMCNRALWPLMHLLPPKYSFSSHHWTTYRQVNEQFATLAACEIRRNDFLWIQDFHLALTPKLVRAQRPGTPIGLFWHVPFPPEQIFRVLPWRTEFLSGMLGSDLIAFHTRTYVAHFLDACESLLELPVNRSQGLVFVDDRCVRVEANPIGIPAQYFEQNARSERVHERAKRIRTELRSTFIVLGVDRLDYTKGILERLLGFERFLENNPSFHRRVSLVLITVPSRTEVADYAQLKRELDEQVGRVIGRFSSEGWVPVRYLYTQFTTEELIAYYRAADVALVTPLCDGMNLVAKEYVASHPDDDGALVLSEFAGAANELREALLVNPYDIDQIAARLKDALTMDPQSRARRMRSLRMRVHENCLERWSSRFLGVLDEVTSAQSARFAFTS